MKERYSAIDWAKSLFIVLMVFYHYWPPIEFSLCLDSFFMPLFFILSGTLYKKKSILYDFQRLILPIFLIGSMNLFIFTLFFSSKINDIWSFILNGGDLARTNMDLFMGRWFLEIIFLIRILMNFIKAISKKNVIGIIVFTILLLSWLPTVIDIHSYSFLFRLLSALPFYLIGYLLRDWIIEGAKGWSVSISLFVIGVLLALYNGPCNVFHLLWGKNYFLFFLQANYISLFVVKVCSCLRPNKLIEEISSYTLGFLGVHITLLPFLLLFWPGKLSGILFILGGCLSVLWCYCFCRICNQYCPIVIGRNTAFRHDLSKI